MRTLLDILIVVMLLAILAGVLLHHRAEGREMAGVAEARQALAALQAKTVYHAALAGAETDGRVTFPRMIDPGWFGEELPTNTLMHEPRPWIDIAPVGDASFHPPDPVLARPDQGGIWYNPARGIFRFRVPQQVTDRQTLELYNRVNGTHLAELPRAIDERRLPIAMQMPTPETVVRASPDRHAVQQISDGGAEATAPVESARPAAQPVRSLRDLAR